MKVRKTILFLIPVFVFTFFYGLENLDGLRQGTEGFYLQISKEMFNSESFLTPLYLGESHWSKPPLHFWLPFPLYYLNGEPSIYLARMSIAIFSLLALFFIVKWYAKNRNIEKLPLFLFISSSLFFIKYSRIFMMEMLLTLLATLGLMHAYSYIYKREKQYFLSSVLLIGLSILVKGPVSLVMIGLSIGIIFLLRFSKERFSSVMRSSTILISSVIIGSVWFLLCYNQYGSDFIDYFFIRENLGKFKSKSYPIRSVIQGLVLYSLPWSFLILSETKLSMKGFINRIKTNDLTRFCFISFLSFFLLWLIPKQRSHHYAIPSMIFFLILIYEQSFIFIKVRRRENLSYRIIAGFFLILGLLPLLTIYFKDFQSTQIITSVLVTSIILLTTSVLFIRRKKNLTYLFILGMLSISSIWNILVPSFATPFVDSAARKLMANKTVGVVVRKPYYVEEAINKNVDVYDPAQIREKINTGKNQIYLVHRDLFEKNHLQSVSKIVHSWTIWRRGRNLSHIKEALSIRNLSILKEDLVLIERL